MRGLVDGFLVSMGIALLARYLQRKRSWLLSSGNLSFWGYAAGCGRKIAGQIPFGGLAVLSLTCCVAVKFRLRRRRAMNVSGKEQGRQAIAPSIATPDSCTGWEQVTDKASGNEKWRRTCPQ